MATRILAAVVGIPLLLAVLLVFPPVCLPVVLSILCVIIVYEVAWATGAVRHKGLVIASALFAAFVPHWFYFSAELSTGIGMVFCFFVVVFAFALSSGQTISFGQIGISFFAGIVLPMLLSTFVLLSDLDHGRFFVLLPFVSAFTSDAFALFAGMAFGKHKLAPVLSPKKTIEGSTGGFLGSVACCVIYGVVVQAVWHFSPDYPVLVLYGLLGSLISQMGDLSFSYIKREMGIKDYGHLIPGHGGILDRFDSVIFCAPFTYIMVMVLPFFRF